MNLKILIIVSLCTGILIFLYYKRKYLTRENFGWLIAILYASLMLITAGEKFRDFIKVREQLSLMPLIEPVSDLLAWALPLTEIILAVLVFLPLTRKIGLYLVTALMVVFTGYVVYLIKYAPHLPCTCGGFMEQLSWPQHLVFNSIFILLGVVGLFLIRLDSRKPKEVDYHLG